MLTDLGKIWGRPQIFHKSVNILNFLDLFYISGGKPPTMALFFLILFYIPGFFLHLGAECRNKSRNFKCFLHSRGLSLHSGKKRQTSRNILFFL